jgi:hypothetical protein
LPVNVDPHLVWTIVDEDGRLYVRPGFRFVNRIDYVLCQVPWTDEDVEQPDYRYDWDIDGTSDGSTASWCWYRWAAARLGDQQASIATSRLGPAWASWW